LTILHLKQVKNDWFIIAKAEDKIKTFSMKYIIGQPIITSLEAKMNTIDNPGKYFEPNII
jgi:hypothetical protein